MKKTILLMLLAFMPMVMFAQQTQKGFSPTDLAILRTNIMGCKIVSDTQLMGDLSVYTTLEMVDYFNQYIDTTTNKQISCIQYKDVVANIYREIGEGVAYYSPRFMKSSSIIPMVCKYKNSNVLVINGLIYGSTYNTIKMDERQRASSIVVSALLPCIAKMTNLVQGKVGYVGLSICYGSKDFSEKYESAKSDYLLMIVPVDLLNDFAACYITEDELISKSDFILSSRDGFSQMKKIKISLDN